MQNPVRLIWRALVKPIQARKAFKTAVADLTSWTPRDQTALDFYSQLIPSGSLCFDVGANVGNRTKVFARLASRVIAVEPQGHCVKILSLLLPSRPQVEIVSKAIGANCGEIEMFISSSNMLSTVSRDWMELAKSTNRFGGDVWRASNKVSMITLDDLIVTYGLPAFIKIDVEGFELEVLKGLSKPVQAISFEFVPERLTRAFDCINLLEALGPVELNFGLNETLEFRLSKWLTPDEFKGHLALHPLSSLDFGDIYVRTRTN